jgi:hypothetical protein
VTAPSRERRRAGDEFTSSFHLWLGEWSTCSEARGKAAKRVLCLLLHLQAASTDRKRVFSLSVASARCSSHLPSTMIARSLHRFPLVQAFQRRPFVSVTLLSKERYEAKTKAELADLLRSRGLKTCG